MKLLLHRSLRRLLRRCPQAGRWRMVGHPWWKACCQGHEKKSGGKLEKTCKTSNRSSFQLKKLEKGCYKKENGSKQHQCLKLEKWEIDLQIFRPTGRSVKSFRTLTAMVVVPKRHWVLEGEVPAPKATKKRLVWCWRFRDLGILSYLKHSYRGLCGSSAIQRVYNSKCFDEGDG